MTRIDLGDLTARDIGRIVSITHQGTTISGVLAHFAIGVEVITAYSNPGIRSVVSMSLTIGRWSADGLPSSTGVEIER